MPTPSEQILALERRLKSTRADIARLQPLAQSAAAQGGKPSRYSPIYQLDDALRFAGELEGQIAELEGQIQGALP